MDDTQCVVFGKKIIIAGSYECEKSYIFEKGKWEEFIEMPFTPDEHAVAKVDKSLFAFNEMAH